MRASHFFRSMSVVTSLIAVAPVHVMAANLSPDVGTQQGTTIPQVYEKLMGLGYRNIVKIERQADAFKVRASGKNGEPVKLYVDAGTGAVRDLRQANRMRYERAADGTWRDTADCNKRRCRDDLSQKDGSPTRNPENRPTVPDHLRP